MDRAAILWRLGEDVVMRGIYTKSGMIPYAFVLVGIFGARIGFFSFAEVLWTLCGLFC